jgi:membrane fusion protein, multidrug efflux system
MIMKNRIKSLQLTFLLAFFLINACKKSENIQPIQTNISDQSVKVKTTYPSQGNEDQDIEVLGIVVSDQQAKPSFKTGGVIAKTHFKEGDEIKKGQLLATLVMGEINSQVNQAEIAVSKATRDLNRVKNLLADSVATLEQFQNATTAYEFANKTLDIAKFNKQYSEVRSPINGRIIKQIMSEGEITGPGIPIYAIMGTGKSDWKITVGLIDKDWARVSKGDLAHINLDAFPDKKFDLIISQKSVIGGNASSTIDVELKFKNTPQNLAAGLIGKVKIKNPKASTQNQLSIPLEALTKSNGSSAVIFVHQQGRAKETKISIGNILGDRVEVLEGLDVHTEVITLGSMYLEDGDKIKIETTKK